MKEAEKPVSPIDEKSTKEIFDHHGSVIHLYLESLNIETYDHNV